MTKTQNIRPVRTHVVAYWSKNGEAGVALVPSARTRPSWSECAKAIPGFVTARAL